MDFLKRDLAPITDQAWEEIEEEAKNTLSLNLSGRRIVDVTGPLGLDCASVNLGRLEVSDQQDDEVRYGLRRVLPLVEVRSPFSLDIWDLDNVDRGARDLDTQDLQRSAKALAKFEERSVYDGFPKGSIDGLVGSSAFEPVALEADPCSLSEAVSRAVLRLRFADVDGPYALALGAALYQLVGTGSEHGYPISKRITDQIGGPIVLAPYLSGGVLISQRGGDAELVLGQDVAIGYQSHDEHKVQLYLTESFTFRVLGPEAVVFLNVDGV